MQMTFRWYGDGNDDITPEMIRQIPGVSGLVWALHDKQPGEIWTVEEIEKVRARIEGAGFHMDVVESVNVHDDIKIGLPTRDQYIENYTDGYLVSDYAKDAMNWAISAGYIRGGSNRCLMPKSIVTRAQFSVFLYRYSRDLLCNTRQDYSKDYGIRFEYPSDRQSIIEYGRDFYVIADFIGNVEISEYDRVEVNVISHKTWKTLRTVYSEKKCDYDNLNVNYEGLTVLSDGGNREAFRAAGMPDLVYDRSNPETFADTWIKCFYDDNRINKEVNVNEKKIARSSGH